MALANCEKARELSPSSSSSRRSACGAAATMRGSDLQKGCTKLKLSRRFTLPNLGSTATATASSEAFRSSPCVNGRCQTTCPRPIDVSDAPSSTAHNSRPHSERGDSHAGAAAKIGRTESTPAINSAHQRQQQSWNSISNDHQSGSQLSCCSTAVSVGGATAADDDDDVDDAPRHQCPPESAAWRHHLIVHTTSGRAATMSSCSSSSCGSGLNQVGRDVAFNWCCSGVVQPVQRFELLGESDVHLCKLQHSATVIAKILSCKYLRRWETHHLFLNDACLSSKTVKSYARYILYCTRFN